MCHEGLEPQVFDERLMRRTMLTRHRQNVDLKFSKRAPSHFMSAVDSPKRTLQPSDHRQAGDLETTFSGVCCADLGHQLEHSMCTMPPRGACPRTKPCSVPEQNSTFRSGCYSPFLRAAAATKICVCLASFSNSRASRTVSRGARTGPQKRQKFK